MRRFVLTICLCFCVLAGCQVGPTGNPPPYPQPSFEYSYSQVGGATVIEIETVDPGGLSDEPLRIIIGDDVAYENGQFYDSYRKSQQYNNEWKNGVETGDIITVTNSAILDPGTEVSVQLSPPDRSGYVTVSTNEVPSSVTRLRADVFI